MGVLQAASCPPLSPGGVSALRKALRLSASRANLTPMEAPPSLGGTEATLGMGGGAPPGVAGGGVPEALMDVVEVTPSRISTATLDWSFSRRPDGCWWW